MNTQDELNDGAKAPDRHPGVANSSRRRFARAGFAAPVVLASLSSKPVLGAVPKACTVSGQVSGNLSPQPGGGDAGGCVRGQSRSTWIAAPSWAGTPITKGDLPDGATCELPTGGTLGTEFNGFGSGLVPGGLAAKMFFATATTGGASSCVVSTTPTAAKASMYQVLKSDATSPEVALAQAVVVSLLNFYVLGVDYPVTGRTIVDMFNTTVNGGSYPVNATQSWTQGQVLTYLTGLYPPG